MSSPGHLRSELHSQLRKRDAELMERGCRSGGNILELAVPFASFVFSTIFHVGF
jgi:hypothetical protein